jgi:Zn-dependent protease
MTFSPDQLIPALLTFIVILGSLTVHEWGHAAMADRLGDDTPRSQGRVTFNPFAHIDLVGTVIIPLLGILGVFGGFALVGWAKPVMINPANIPRTSDRAWVTIAGPGMNLIIALVASIAAPLSARYAPGLEGFLGLVVRINVALMVFNLLPIPPLDGSKFLMYWFGMSEAAYEQFSRFGWIILMVLLNLPQTRGLLGRLIAGALVPFETISSLFA